MEGNNDRNRGYKKKMSERSDVEIKKTKNVKELA